MRVGYNDHLLKTVCAQIERVFPVWQKMAREQLTFLSLCLMKQVTWGR